MSSSRIAAACPPRRQYLATRKDLSAAGLGPRAVAAKLASGDLVRVRRGVYSPTALAARSKHLVSGGSPDPAYLAEVRAALLSLGPTAIAGGRTAAVLWGFDMLVEPAEVDVVVRHARADSERKGVVVRRRRGLVAVRHRVLGLDAVKVLTPALTVVDCALSRPLREAVVIADSTLRSGRVTLAELHRWGKAYWHKPGGVRLRRVLSLVDAESGSVLESALRVLLAQHGLHPESQVRLEDGAGRLIGRVDFLLREQRLVIECDGRRWHDPADVRERDRIRDNELERAAWRLVRVTWAEVVHEPEHVVQLVRDCLEPWPLAA